MAGVRWLAERESVRVKRTRE
ncbi:uncharacterized protein G2W53_015361 [Senna tora]|uniref:Uncharacterized protein n=1 Tax=Senna tora TaxID=362788 RepID=A0A834WVC8_9FABA|nr:uncharacterized protein G2W53_015361 [Senna tora]